MAGDAGIGKTRVLAEIARQTRERGLLLLAGGSYEAEGRLPLGALHDAVLDYIEAQADEVLQVQLGGLLPGLARVVPELRDRFPDLPDERVASLEEERPRLFWTITRVFERISEAQPLVLLLDDLQWADDTTLQVLHFLTRQAQLGRMLTVGAYRTGETPASEGLARLLSGRARAPRVRQIDLQPIDQHELANVLAARLGGACAPDLTRAVHERSGGNPLFALEIVGLLQQKGKLQHEGAEKGNVYDDALAALDEAAARHERLGDLPGVGVVTGALVQVHSLRGSWKQGRERVTRVVGRLEGVSPRSSELSRALADLYLASTYLYDAGPGERLGAAERAEQLARLLGDGGLIGRAGMRRGFLLYGLRRYAEAQEVIEALIPLAEGAQDASTLRFAVDILADIDKLEGRLEQSLRGRERALDFAEKRPDEPHWIMVGLAQLAEARYLLGDWSGARALYERAVEMSRLYPAPHYAAFALLGLGALDLAEGRWEEASQLVEICIADARATNDVHWARNGQRLLAQRDLLTGRPHDALHRLEDEGEDHTGTLYLRAWAYLETGDVQRAAATVDRCIDLAGKRSNGLDLSEAWIVRGRICVRQGCFADAERSFGEALSLARSLPFPYAEARALCEWGIMDSQRGQLQRARDHLAAAHEILHCLGAKPYLDRIDQVLAAAGIT